MSSYPIILPADIDVVGRWQDNIRRDNLTSWRSLSFMFSAAAKIETVNGNMEAASNLLCLFELALQRCFDLYPREVKEAA